MNLREDIWQLKFESPDTVLVSENDFEIILELLSRFIKLDFKTIRKRVSGHGIHARIESSPTKHGGIAFGVAGTSSINLTLTGLFITANLFLYSNNTRISPEGFTNGYLHLQFHHEKGWIIDGWHADSLGEFDGIQYPSVK